MIAPGQHTFTVTLDLYALPDAAQPLILMWLCGHMSLEDALTGLGYSAHEAFVRSLPTALEVATDGR